MRAGSAAIEATPLPAGEAAPGAPAGGATPAPSIKLSAVDVAAALAETSTPGAPAATPAPQIAGDVDVLEPEWVDKADQVVRAHAGDPYAEEEAIEELQQDYLQKRYGIKVADPNADDTKPKGV